MTSPILPKHKDTAQGQLLSGISAAGLTVTLKTGEGAEFPQPYTGSCSSTGSATALNDTGDLAGVAQYDYIRNVTDGSWAICLTTGTNSIVTTRLQGGTLNVWTSGDEWRVGEFVITLADITTNAYGVQTINVSEKSLVKNRSGDILTVATGGRGYDSSSAQIWDADDYVNLFVASVTPEGIRGIVAELARLINTNITDITTNSSDIDSIESNATFYVAAAGSSNAFTGTLAKMPAAYTTGERLFFKANHTINGSASFNRAGLGAKTIKKLDGATDLATGDIQSGQIVEIVYDGTNYLMVSPLGQVPGTKFKLIGSQTSTAGGDTVGNTGAATDFASTINIPTSSLTLGDTITLHAWGHVSTAGSNTDIVIQVRLDGNMVLTTDSFTLTASMTTKPWHIIACWTVRSIGASGTLMGHGELRYNSTAVTGNMRLLKDSTGGTAPTTVTVDTTQVLTASINIDWTTADPSNTITMQQFFPHQGIL